MSNRSICGSISRVIGAAVATCLLIGPAPAGAAGAQSQYAVAYQINRAHSGEMPLPAGAPPLAPPLTLSWSRNLGGPISYPLIAEGMVFVTVGDTDHSGTQFFALQLATGAVEYQKLIGGWSNAAYDRDRIFLVNSNAQLQAFEAATGTPDWVLELPGQLVSEAAPTASGGRVFATATESGGTIYGVDEESGSLIWMAPVANGQMSVPTIGDRGVYVSYPCQVYKFAPLTGALLWHDDRGCDGGGGTTSVYHGKRLYVRDSFGSGGRILDAATGADISQFSAIPVPAFSGPIGLTLTNGRLYGFDVHTGNVLWSFAGDGQLTSAPIVFGGAVFVGSGSGELYMLDKQTGALEWSTNVGSPIPAPDEYNNSQPLTGLGAGQGTLVVPAGSQISAYVPGTAALATVR